MDWGGTVPAVSLERAFAVECAFSAVLALVIVAAATDDRLLRSVAPFVIGATVLVLVGGPLTGGAHNPARTLRPAAAAGGWTAHWLYWAAPTAGMLAAARLSEYLRGTNQPAVVPRGVPLGVEGPLDE